MREYTVVEYEQENFDKIKSEMTKEKAIDILSGLPRGWFPYRLPSWSEKVSSSDLENYEICCAIYKAIELLESENTRAEEW